MSNAIYPLFLQALSQQDLDATTVDWWLLPLDTDYGFNPGDAVLGDVSGDAVGAGLQLTFDGLAIVGLSLRYTTSGPLVFTDITSADDVGSWVIYADDGVDTWLAAFIDTRSDTSPAAVFGTGDSVDVSFPGGWFIQL